MDDALVWGLNNEAKVFGPTLWIPYAQYESYEVFECLVLASEEAKKVTDDPARQRTILKRKARNLFIDRLRRRFGTTTDECGKPAFRYEVTYDSDVLGAALNRNEASLIGPEFSWESLDPEVVHAAIRARFTAEQVWLFELTVAGDSSEAIGQELGLTAATVRKRWERLRPALADCIAEASGLDHGYVARLLATRTRKHSTGTGSLSQGTET